MSAFSELLDLPARELALRVRSGATTAESVARAAIDRIRARDGAIGAFLTIAEERAIASARELDRRRASGGTLGPLAGVPIGIKDALVTKDLATTAGSRILCRQPDDPSTGYRPPYDATVVRRLEQAGAIVVGKCSMDEFAMGSSNERCAFGPVRHPLDPSRVPGGSSGGSAAAVAGGMTPLAIGSDTGGSIRQPAAFTGTVGFKPTYGRVSRYGLIAFASSLDQIGAFARDVADAALVTEIVAGHDPLDATSLTAEVGAFVPDASASLAKTRLGVPREYLGEGLEPGVRRAFDRALDAARSAGAEIVSISLPHTRFAVSTYYVVATAEASSNLARFDGVRYGAREKGDSIAEVYRRTRERGFGSEVKRRILLGTFVLSAGYYDAYYLRAQKARTLIARDFDEAFRSVDAVVTPTAPTVAFRLGAKLTDPLAMYLADVFTLPASLAGLPGVSVPCGRAGPPDDPAATPLPVGLQIVCPPLEDARALRVARGFEALGLGASPV